MGKLGEQINRQVDQFRGMVDVCNVKDSKEVNDVVAKNFTICADNALDTQQRRQMKGLKEQVMMKFEFVGMATRDKGKLIPKDPVAKRATALLERAEKKIQPATRSLSKGRGVDHRRKQRSCAKHKVFCQGRNHVVM